MRILINLSVIFAVVTLVSTLSGCKDAEFAEVKLCDQKGLESDEKVACGEGREAIGEIAMKGVDQSRRQALEVCNCLCWAEYEATDDAAASESCPAVLKDTQTDNFFDENVDLQNTETVVTEAGGPSAGDMPEFDTESPELNSDEPTAHAAPMFKKAADSAVIARLVNACAQGCVDSVEKKLQERARLKAIRERRASSYGPRR
jgi:hypothetical protein